MPRTTSRVIIILLAAGILAVPVCSQPPQRGSSASEDRPKADRPRPSVTVGRETTFILGPLRPDGYVDYVAALNEQCSEGVTPENNAAVLICGAFGPSDIATQSRARARFFQMLGIDALPEEGRYIVTVFAFEAQLAKERPPVEMEESMVEGFAAAANAVDEPEEPETFYDRLNKAMERPWSKEEFPDVARWLEINQEPLQLVFEATSRPRFYAPMVTGDSEEGGGTVIAILLPVLQQCRDAARLLAVRAMVRLGEGRTDEAWQDLLACHRLARLCGQDPTLIGALVSIAIDGIAYGGDAALMHHGKLSADQACKMIADLEGLVPLPSMAESIDTAERFMYLDAVTAMARGDVGVDDLVGGESGSVTDGLLRAASGLLIDWDLVLRNANSWYDRMAEAWRKPTHLERAQAMNALDDELAAMSEEMGEEIRSPWKTAGALLLGKSPRRAASEAMSNVLTALLLPAVTAARKAEDRGRTYSRLNQIGFALAAYRADRGRSPEDLDELAPKYIAQIPVDLFTGHSFRYRPDGEGFLVYSLGPNMEDNGGKVDYLDEKKAVAGEDTSQWDDYRLRIPVEVE